MFVWGGGKRKKSREIYRFVLNMACGGGGLFSSKNFQILEKKLFHLFHIIKFFMLFMLLLFHKR